MVKEIYSLSYLTYSYLWRLPQEWDTENAQESLKASFYEFQAF